MEKAAEMLSLDGQIKKRIWGQFWSAHQVCMKRTTAKLSVILTLPVVSTTP